MAAPLARKATDSWSWWISGIRPDAVGSLATNDGVPDRRPDQVEVRIGWRRFRIIRPNSAWLRCTTLPKVAGRSRSAALVMAGGGQQGHGAFHFDSRGESVKYQVGLAGGFGCVAAAFPPEGWTPRIACAAARVMRGFHSATSTSQYPPSREVDASIRSEFAGFFKRLYVDQAYAQGSSYKIPADADLPVD